MLVFIFHPYPSYYEHSYEKILDSYINRRKRQKTRENCYAAATAVANVINVKVSR